MLPNLHYFQLLKKIVLTLILTLFLKHNFTKMANGCNHLAMKTDLYSALHNKLNKDSGGNEIIK